MKTPLMLVLVLALAATAGAAGPSPYDSRDSFTAKNAVDKAVLKALRKRGIKPARICSDAVFVRRVYLDVCGTLPTYEEVTAFLADRSKDKRERLVDALLARPEFAEYQALRWCDLLRVKAEFPINLWPNAVQAYHRWIRNAVRDNMPYDRFARELLTSSGSNFRVPAVNFSRAIQGRSPEELAKAAALTFMGVRIEGWPEERRAGLGAFFSRVAYKRTLEWKEEVVYTSPGTEPVAAILPDGTRLTIGPEEDPRQVFADWLVSPTNRWFTESAVNRVWAWLLGRGIVHEPDDFREDNPPSNPALLSVLARELVLSDFDLKHVYRIILNSATYQQSPVSRSKSPKAEELFAHYIVRQLDAEVLIDALCRLSGTEESYMSAIPEPFTFVPGDQRSISLADGSISSPFLEMFGRPARDTGLMSERNRHPTAGQRLHLLNSRDIKNRVTQALMRIAGRMRGRDPKKAVNRIYLTILSRPPTDAEWAILTEHLRSGPRDPRQNGEDLVWALINSKEFLFRH